MPPQSPSRRAARASGLLTLFPFLLTPAGKIGVGATLTALVTGSLLIGAPLGGDSKPIASHSPSAAPTGTLPIRPLAHSGETDETPLTLEVGGVPVLLAAGLAPDAQTSGFVPVHMPDGIPPSAGLLPAADFGPPAAQSVPAWMPDGGNPPPNIVTPQPSGAPTNPSSGSTPQALPPTPRVPPGSSLPPPVEPHLSLPTSPGVPPGAKGPNPPASPAAPPSPGETTIPAGPQPMATPQPSSLASPDPSGHSPSGPPPKDTQLGPPSWLPPDTSVPHIDETVLVQPFRQASAQATTNTVPEPASLALLAAGLASMMWLRRATSRSHRLRVG